MYTTLVRENVGSAKSAVPVEPSPGLVDAIETFFSSRLVKFVGRPLLALATVVGILSYIEPVERALLITVSLFAISTTVALYSQHRSIAHLIENQNDLVSYSQLTKWTTEVLDGLRYLLSVTPRCAQGLDANWFDPAQPWRGVGKSYAAFEKAVVGYIDYLLGRKGRYALYFGGVDCMWLARESGWFRIDLPQCIQRTVNPSAWSVGHLSNLLLQGFTASLSRDGVVIRSAEADGLDEFQASVVKCANVQFGMDGRCASLAMYPISYLAEGRLSPNVVGGLLVISENEDYPVLPDIDSLISASCSLLAVGLVAAGLTGTTEAKHGV